ncbi:c-di-GMP-binding flagellar brake protein YcgR, contains PilZNR and PilZ domains [Halopseudomonas litoralis]|uniref:C-di-GMP-binding flagellar brake protein YcgR, contains PilZNR and PilZ domains n=1 Tax=Halopseudomonas litoralis TaxID=797277 RepID=A0A1H1WWM1_9GAMM|nr:flagellar brake protein [Halopseudomonas litoralis]SDT00756.1 c-di-GMP-binding flagellar brake protein YcgR, contains PilZNR and PilZ domains [Halopseudomonas litoralis]
MLLKLLDSDDFVLGAPLPWDLLDAEGKVLFRQSQRIDSGPLLQKLIDKGVYRRAEATAELQDQAPVSLSQLSLAPGDMLQLQVLSPNHSERYQVRVIGFHAPISLLVTAPTLNGRLVFIKEGQRFLARGFIGKDAVAYNTRVLKSSLAPFAYLHLAWPDEVQTMRIRSSSRVSVDLVCMVTGEQGQSAARIADLSPGGARVVSTVPFAASGDELKLAFRINPGGVEVYLNVAALVRAVSQDGDQVITGVEFIRLSEADRLYLTNMVYQNLLKEKL